ncbi:MAG: hypothetical protein JNK45_36295 [Myxococcales bacterium]|nr:hypothetical protein [Myxococcales bacterium]
MAIAVRSPLESTSPATMGASPGPSVALRWLTLVVVAAAIAYSYLADVLAPGGSDIATVSRRYDNAFTPAPFAFAIWGLIYASFVAHCVVALLPSRRTMEIYDRLAVPLMLANVLGALWVAAFRHDMVFAALLLVATMFAVAWFMLLAASRWVDTGRARFWLTVPFALFFGWMAVATLANLAAARVAAGWTGGPVIEFAWAVGLLVVATAIGLGVGVRRRAFLVPAVVAWATAAIAVATRGSEPGVGTAAVVASVACGIAAVALAVHRAWIREPAQLVSGTLGSHRA